MAIKKTGYAVVSLHRQPKDGVNLTSVINYYLWGNSSSTEPTGTWSENAIPTHVYGTDYLWNYEVCKNASGGIISTSAKRCIGYYPNGVSKIYEYYLVNSGSTPDTSAIVITKGTTEPATSYGSWKQTPDTTTETDRYLWNVEVTKMESGDYNVGTPHCSGVQGVSGKSAIFADLDNEFDTMLYDGSGTAITTEVTSQGSLYSGGTKITTGVTWALGSSSGVSSDSTVSASGQITVKGMTANSGYVIANATYNGATYPVKFTVTKLVGTDKYEIKTTPNAVTYNSTTKTFSSTTIVVDIIQTKQNGSRQSLSALPDGYTLKCNDTAVTYDGGATISVVATTANYNIVLYDASSKVLDAETVALGTYQDGSGWKGITLDCPITVIQVDKDSEVKDNTDYIVTANLTNITGTVAWTVYDDIGGEYVDNESFEVKGNTLTIHPQLLYDDCHSAKITATLDGYSAVVTIGFSVDGDNGANGNDGADGADGIQPNLYGYDTTISNSNVVHTPDGFALNEILNGTFSVSLDALSAGTYAISGYITASEAISLRMTCGNATTKGGSSTKNIAANTKTAFAWKYTITAASTPYFLFSGDTTRTLITITELKIEEAAALTGVNTAYNGLAADTIPQGQNLILESQFRLSERFSTFNGISSSNLLAGITGFVSNTITMYVGTSASSSVKPTSYTTGSVSSQGAVWARFYNSTLEYVVFLDNISSGTTVNRSRFQYSADGSTWDTYANTYNVRYIRYNSSGTARAVELDLVVQDITGRLKTDTWYTLSYWHKSSGTNGSFYSCVKSSLDGTYPLSPAGGVDVVDGVAVASSNDNEHNVTAGDSIGEWKRHTVTFRTASSFGSSYTHTLVFRTYDLYSHSLVMPKLEECERATDWCTNEADKAGSQLRPRGKYDSTVTDYVYSTEYRDVVLYEDNWYVVKSGISVVPEGAVPSDTSKYWQKNDLGNFQFLATDLLLSNTIYASVLTAVQAQIDKLVVKRLECTDANDNKVSSINENGDGLTRYYYPSGNVMREDTWVYDSAGTCTGIKTTYYDSDGNVKWVLDQSGLSQENIDAWINNTYYYVKEWGSEIKTKAQIEAYCLATATNYQGKFPSSEVLSQYKCVSTSSYSSYNNKIASGMIYPNTKNPNTVSDWYTGVLFTANGVQIPSTDDSVTAYRFTYITVDNGVPSAPVSVVETVKN